MPKKEETAVVQIAKIKKKVVHVKLIGDSPLIMHAWSTKAKLMLLDAQQGKKKGKTKDFKNPVRDFIDSMYWLSGKPDLPDNATEEQCEIAFNKAISEGARFGFPCTAFKQAGNSAAYRAGLVKNQMGLRATYYIEPNDGVEWRDDIAAEEWQKQQARHLINCICSCQGKCNVFTYHSS